jgi:hypothetical protein
MGKYVLDVDARWSVTDLHYPVRDGLWDTGQHTCTHTGSVGVRGSNPLSSTGKTRDQTVSGFLLGGVGVGPDVLTLSYGVEGRRGHIVFASHSRAEMAVPSPGAPATITR